MITRQLPTIIYCDKCGSTEIDRTYWNGEKPRLSMSEYADAKKRTQAETLDVLKRVSIVTLTCRSCGHTVQFSTLPEIP